MGTGIAVSVWGLIIAGIMVLALFIGWQAVNRRERWFAELSVT